jgi:hypothetical protein
VHLIMFPHVSHSHYLQYVSRSVPIYGLYVPKKTIVSHMCVQYVPNLLQYVPNISPI